MTTEQRWDPDGYARNAAFVPALGEPLVELLAPRPGERILDLGCGDGALTQKLVAFGCEVLAVDASAEQVEAARRRGIHAEVMDGHALRFAAEFDGVFSNAALHWMTRPRAVADGVWRALRSGGRFVAELGGKGNLAAIRDALEKALARRGVETRGLQPWYFPAAEEYRSLLEQAGFDVRLAELFRRPTTLPGDIGDWLDTFAQPFLSAVPLAERDALKDDVRSSLCSVLCDGSGRWTADYVRLRVKAFKVER
jgi:trans-aconitate methyltransferase